MEKRERTSERANNMQNENKSTHLTQKHNNRQGGLTYCILYVPIYNFSFICHNFPAQTSVLTNTKIPCCVIILAFGASCWLSVKGRTWDD